MRTSIWAGWLLLALVQSSFGLSEPASSSDNGLSERATTPEDTEDSKDNDDDFPDDAAGPTEFNGITVPPLKELPGTGFEESIKDGYWFVKHYSPYCGFCIAAAPVWQTLYEFYYTSNPLLSSTTKEAPDSEKSLNSFTGYYDFHFASMNCVAYSDKCKSIGIDAFPEFVLYRNGEKIATFEGKRSIKSLSDFVEEKLELIKPGSRPRNGITLPRKGDKEGKLEALPDPAESSEKEPEKESEKEQSTNQQASKKPKHKGDEKPRALPNPQGTSVPLTAENFLRLVTTTQDPWFIKFHVPWCPHCQSLAPTWLQMAKDMKGKLNIGEVNCEVERRLCKDARVTSYPTMYFFRGGERVEYDGLRGLGDLVSYAKKAVDVVGNGVQYVDAAAFKELEETEEVIFLYFFDAATTSEDLDALDRLTLSLVGRARIVKTNSTILAERFRITTFPRLMVSRDGRANYYEALAPKDMRDFRQALEWMKSVWLPIVPELTASNAREILEGKYAVLGILNRQRSDEFIQDKRELKNAALEWMDKQTRLFQLERQELRDAKQLRIEEADDRNDQRALRAAKSTHITIKESDKKQVNFAWVDGIFWDRWLRTTYGIDVKNGERVIINDDEFRRYWDASPNGQDIMPSRTSILETLSQIYSSPTRLKSKSTIGFFEGTFFSINTFVSGHPIISVILLLVTAAIIVLSVRSKGRRGRSGSGLLGMSGSGSKGFFHLDGKEGLLGSMGGGQGNGKVD